MGKPNKQSGMSLTEVLITLGISSIVMLIVVSLMQSLSKANRVTMEISERADIDHTIQNIIAKTADICGNAFQSRPADGSADATTSDRYVSIGLLTSSGNLTDYPTLIEGTTKATVNTIVWNKDRFPYLGDPTLTPTDDTILYKVGDPTFTNSALKIKEIIITKISGDEDIKISSKNNVTAPPELYKRALFKIHLFLEKIKPDASTGPAELKVTNFNMAGIWKSSDPSARMEYCYSEQSPTYFCQDFMDGTLLNDTFNPRCLLSRLVSANNITSRSPYAQTSDGLKFQIFDSSNNIKTKSDTEAAINSSSSLPLSDYNTLPTKMHIHGDGNIGIGMSTTEPGILSTGTILLPKPKVHIKGDLLVEGSINTSNRLKLITLEGPSVFSTETKNINFTGVNDKNIIYCSINMFSLWGKAINSTCQVYTTDTDSNGILEWHITVNSASRSTLTCKASCLVQEEINSTVVIAPTLPSAVVTTATGTGTSSLHKCPSIPGFGTQTISQCVGQITEETTCKVYTFDVTTLWTTEDKPCPDY